MHGGEGRERRQGDNKMNNLILMGVIAAGIAGALLLGVGIYRLYLRRRTKVKP